MLIRARLSRCAGWFKFVANPNGDNLPTSVHVSYDLTGLPQGNHGFHVHTWGEILGYADAMSTGGHFIGASPSSVPGLSLE